MPLKNLSTLTEIQLQRLFTLLAALIACQVMYIQHGWINDDSVLYFEMARLFSMGEWKQGVALFSWPLYPVLISFIQRLTQFEIQTSAQILNVLFFGVTTYSFISLIRLAGGNKTTIICGGLLLLSSSYIVGDVLPMLMRDQGFWAAFLTSLVYFIRFYRDKKMSDALLWQICAIVAVLFRIEAITYLACLPFVLLIQREFTMKQRLAHFFQINLLPIFALVAMLSTLVIMPSVQFSDFGRLQEVVTIIPRMFTSVAQTFSDKADLMNEKILGSFFDDFGMMGIIISLASIVVFKVISLIGWPVAGIFILSRHVGTPTQIMRQDTRQILRWVAAIALLNACVITASAFVLSGRYIIAIGFILLIFAAFHLASLIEKIRANQIEKPWQKILLYILIALLTFSAVKNSWPKRAGHNFEQDAVAYLKQQQVPNNKVFFVTPRSRYYAGAPYAGRGHDYWNYTQAAIADGSINQYDYLVINLDVDAQYAAREKILAEKLPQYKLAKEFYGLRNKKKIMLFEKK